MVSAHVSLHCSVYLCSKQSVELIRNPQKHQERTLMSYAEYNQMILKLFILADSVSFSNQLPPSFDKADII